MFVYLLAAALTDDPAPAQAPTPPAAPTITVNAKRPDVVQKIDRRIYTIPADAKSATSDGYALLRGLPAITVGLNDTVTLLGSGNVTVLVDNKAPPEGNQVLRSLHGADIDHIEVMTNPSAEYAPDGTGGIINIVLKKKHRQGLSGSVIADVDSFGAGGMEANIKLVTGPWSFDSQLRARRLAWKSSFTTLRDAESVVGGPPTSDFQTSAGHGHSEYFGGQETIGYKIDAKTTVTLSGFAGRNKITDITDSSYLGLTPDFASFNQQAVGSFQFNYSGAEFSLDHEGARQGETLKADVNYVYLENPQRTQYTLAYLAPAESAAFQTYNAKPQKDLSAKLDYTHPMSGGRILSLGASDSFTHVANNQSFTNTSAPTDLGLSYVDAITGKRNIAAVYGSFQQPLGTWTLLPALRFEIADFKGQPATLPSFATHAASFYPSVHLSHTLAKGLDMNLSYAKRTDRPDITQLNPFTVVTSTTSVAAGNPGLRNQSTDAYEANFTYTKKALTTSMILYDRETSDLWNTAFSITPAGLTEAETINAGHKSDRGAEFDINTPLGGGFKITSSVNLFDSRVPTDLSVGAATEDQFRYTGNATLEWNAPAKGDQPGNSAQIQLAYESPSQGYQIRYGPRLTPSFSLSHPLAKKLSVVLSAENAFGVAHNGHVLNAALTQEWLVERIIGPRVALKLVRMFGK